MPAFSYIGFDTAGAKVSGTIEATGRKSALGQLRQRGIYPTNINEEGTSTAKTGRAIFSRRRISQLDLATTARQLATLLGAGIPLDEALETTAEQQENRTLQRALQRGHA